MTKTTPVRKPGSAERYREPDKVDMYVFDFLNSAGWEQKYDRLYRELKPREQFGKTFNSRFPWRKSA